MIALIAHGRDAESIESKTLWFQSLPIEERAEMLNSFCDLILEINPKIAEQKSAEPVKGRIRVISKT